MPKLAIASLALAVVSVGLEAQSGTNFSGTWVLEAVAPDSAAVPQRLVVQQPITTTNMLGVPMPPAYLYLNVERWFQDEVRKDTYQIGVVGGFVGAGSGAASATPQSRWSVTWQDAALRMEWENVGGSAGSARRVETWHLDNLKTLLISVESTQENGVETQTATYRRADQ